jgi:hypothetical protein
MNSKFERPDANEPEGEGSDASDSGRGIPQVGRKRKGNKWTLMLLFSVAIVLMISLGVRTVLDRVKSRSAALRKEAVVERGLPSLTRDAFDARNPPPQALARGATRASAVVPPR